MQKISVVQGETGQVGTLSEEDDAALSLRLEDGQHVAVSRDQLEPLADGTLLLRTPLAELTPVDASDSAPVLATRTVSVNDSVPASKRAPAHAREHVGDEPLTIPRVEEQLVIAKEQHRRGGVRVHVVPTEHEQTVSVPVVDTRAEVRRVEIGRIVASAPPVREEGDTVIISIVEEVLVVEKRLLLREEVHVVRQRTARTEEHRVTLRSERVEVSRDDE